MGTPLSVLIVEDSEDDALLVVRELRRGCYEVVFERVDTAEAMSEALEKKTWDVIISDYVIPRFGGLEALRLLHRSGLDLPFIIVSGKIGEDTAVEAMREGAHDYIMKDNLTRLVPAIEREMREAEVRREKKQADETLRRAYDELEIRIRERTAELARANEALRDEIAEHMRAEEAIRSEHAFRKAIEDSMPGGVAAVDLDGRQIYVNPAFCKMVGWSEEELIGAMPPFVYWPPEDVEVISAGFRDVLNGKIPPGGIEVRFRRRNEERFDVIILLSPLKDGQGRTTGWLASVYDITGRKRTEEELRRSNAELEQFTYIASHDLQEPLRMISIFTQLLARRYKGKLDRSADEFIGYVVDGAIRMQQMLEDLLTYSRIGTHAKPFEQVNCEDVFNQAVANLGVDIEENKATVTHDPLPAIMADASQMVQLFQNLISNAIKFRREEAPRVHVSAERKKNEWVFSVRDNGIGISPDFMGRLFQIFQREHAVSEYPGTGVGLAICRRIVEHHGGRIWAESQLGRGSTFYFTIPARGKNGVIS